MKINGKKIEGPNTQYLAIPRGEGGDIVFKIQAVMDFTSFDALCPQPEPPKKMLVGGKVVPNLESEIYKKELEQWAKRRGQYITLMSLRSSNIEWETVKYDDPSTWDYYQKEMKESGFSEIEMGRIVRATLEVNCLDEDKLEEARQRFLASQEVPKNGLSFHKEEAQNTQSGEPVKDSESNHQDLPMQAAGRIS